MSAPVWLKDAETRMEKALDVFRNELKGLRTGRASPAMLDAIRMDYYGSQTPIKQVANISCPDPASIMIKPFSADDLKEIEKAIRSSDLGQGARAALPLRAAPASTSSTSSTCSPRTRSSATRSNKATAPS